MPDQTVVFGVSDFVAVFNQTVEYAYPSVIIVGEIANLKFSKNRWVYFDLKDDQSKIRFFGSVYDLPGPLQDGMNVRVRGVPRLHPQFGFSITFRTIQPEGEGSIKKASDLLRAKLQAEGLFDPSRKRLLPYPPQYVGLIASSESAGYADFLKILDQRWGGLRLYHADVLVQGESAPVQITQAIAYFNEMAHPPDVLVITRGGGSADDLLAFDDQSVVRAISASRIPTLVAIGHETDQSLSEMVADKRASTPSNAAELLTPERRAVQQELNGQKLSIGRTIDQMLVNFLSELSLNKKSIQSRIDYIINESVQSLKSKEKLVRALSPAGILDRGYAIVSLGDKIVRSVSNLQTSSEISVTMRDGKLTAKVSNIDENKEKQ